MARSRIMQRVSIQLNAVSNFERGLIVVPQWALPFFHDGYRGEFVLRAPGKTAVVYLSSARRGTKVGDLAGQYLWGKGEHRENVFHAIFAANRGWQPGVWANFERLLDESVRVTLTDAPLFQHQADGDDRTSAPTRSVVVRRRRDVAGRIGSLPKASAA